jgi:hypothetical protein
MPHGTFIFTNPPVYGWYISVTAVFLNFSWILHNIIAWLKNKPFLSRRVSYIYIGTVLLSIPFWVMEMYANFAFFNNINRVYLKTRPYETIFRYMDTRNQNLHAHLLISFDSDPWWIFTTLNLFWNIVRQYEFGILEIIRVSPRFAILLVSMTLSVIFIVGDVLSVTSVFKSSLPTGINPFWKLAFVFKCFTDTIILDDFKTALDRLKQYKQECQEITAVRSRDNTTCTRRDLAQPKDVPHNRPWSESCEVTNIEKAKHKQKEDFLTTESELTRWASFGVESSRPKPWN